jgi:hypothetical protein
MRARNWRCAEVGVNCGEPQNGAGESIANYRNWKEIGVSEGEWGECERQVTPVENMALFHVERLSGKGRQAALFHVEQRHRSNRRAGRWRGSSDRNWAEEQVPSTGAHGLASRRRAQIARW